MIKLIQTIALLTLCTHAIGSGILGAHLEWKPSPNSFNSYKITLSLYLDEASDELDKETSEVYLIKNDLHWQNEGVWRFSTHYGLHKISSTQIQQTSLRCHGTKKRDIFLNLYEANISFWPQDQPFSSNGYVIAWHSQSSYREKGDKNFFESSSLCEWVTTFIPRPTVDGINTMKSSPTIGGISDFVVCKDELAEIKIPAIDADGDELKYRLSTPYAVSDIDFVDPITFKIHVGQWAWAPGYNEQNQMHGNPALTINENTGEITVKPSEAGQYFIGISVDEYRNGQKIGTVNFYYTLTVVDCNEQQVWDKDIYQDTTAIQTLTICEGSQVTLTSKQTFPDPQPEFQWTKNGKTIWGANTQSITISEAGEYQLLTKKINGCPDSFESKTVNVTIISSGAEMDSIPPICDTTQLTILNATPPGGTFAGTGVTGNTFDPKIAGEGTHEIQYVIEGSEACPTSIKKREVVVSQAPVLDLVDVLYTSRDKPISIGVKDSLDVVYDWTPPDYLNDVTYANPVCAPTAGITYTVTATNAYGCMASHKVQIRIVENIFIPDAFTPNKDGINETWELKGIEEYPNCRVRIYNRWGEVIFNSVGYQNAFDGTVAGALQMPGVYAYKIRLTENSLEMTGSLTLLR